MPPRRLALILLSALSAAALSVALALAVAPALEEAGLSAMSLVALVAVLGLWWWRRRQHDSGQ